jgi:hypothetical protein
VLCSTSPVHSLPTHRLPAPVQTNPGLLKYLVLAVVPTAEPSGQDPSTPGSPERCHLLLAGLPLLVLPEAPTQEVNWLFKAMVKEEAEQMGVPVPAGFVGNRPDTTVRTVGDTAAAAAGEHSQQQQQAAHPLPEPWSASQEQGGRPAEAQQLDQAYTAPLPRGGTSGPPGTGSGLLPAGVWVQRQSAPLHAFESSSSSSSREPSHVEGSFSRLQQRQVWGAGWPTTTTGLARVQEEGVGGGEDHQQHGARQRPAPPGFPQTGRGRRHGMMAAAAMRELMVVTRASVDSSRTSGSRPSSLEHPALRSSSESVAPMGGPSRPTSLDMGQPQVIPVSSPSTSVSESSPARDPYAGPESGLMSAVHSVSGSTQAAGYGGAALPAEQLTAAPPLSVAPPALEPEWLAAFPASLLASVFTHHLAVFSIDMGMALQPPPAVQAAEMPAYEGGAEAERAGGTVDAAGQVAGEAGGGATAAGALAGVPAEVQQVPDDVRGALATVAGGLLLFLVQHFMLACFEVRGVHPNLCC